MHLAAMLESTARKFPTKEALVHGARRLTFRELDDAARRAAAAFRDAGVRPGDRVAVMTFNTPGFVIAAFGLWRAGAVLVPVNHKLQAPEVARLVTHCGAVLGVADAALAATVRAGAPGVRWLWTEADGADTDSADSTDGAAAGAALGDDFDALVATTPPWEGVPFDHDAIAEILYTSGTTAAPKGCLHTHRGVATVATYVTAAVGLRADDRFLLAMPIWHASPLNNWLLSMVFLGGTTVLLREYHPIEFLRTVAAERTTAFFGAPIAYVAPLQVARAQGVDLASFDLSSARLWLAGGAPVGAETVRQIAAFYPGEFHQVYGMSEMGPVGTTLGPAHQELKAGSIGHAGMPGVDARVVDLDGRDVDPGGTGEIWLRSDTRMVGYLDDDEATRSAFVGDWYRSGDVVRVDEDGFWFIVDRLKDVIITGGENVYSQEVEEALRAHPEVADVAVVGRPHPDWGETIVAFVVASPGTQPTLESVRAYLADRLAHYKAPRHLVLVEALPRNPSGKLTKHVLRRRAAQDDLVTGPL
ncbi:class I adenylate-forming enzyme family protein [Xylanimonas ulmi]|uniref:Feruloyl-CoA synthase n=1 Tax=Xylanimonas ulmi TaxID=228973 RepID=A0A4Q7M3B2_9MICO|nr:AMP-binding protein [Xylanibacterium ulmi]RZS61811.1 feruloyl-CoA synthase [Xylanibacterium ulmi]